MKRFSPWLWLVIAGLLLLVANGANAIFLAAWLAPVFLLRFVRIKRARIALPLAFLVLAITYAFQFRDMIPLPLPVYLAYITFFGIILLIPYALDKWLTPRIKGWMSLMVFPLAWVAVEYLNSFNIAGTLGASIAYSQYGQLPLLQLISVTGLWGITFLIGWFATTINGLWERGFNLRSRVVALFAATMLLVILLGGARMAFFPPTESTVRVAALTRNPIGVDERTVTSHLRKQTANKEEIKKFQDFAQNNNNDLLERAAKEAEAGAKIVVWGEANALVLKQDEPALIAKASELASTKNIYLAMGIVTWDDSKEKPAENKVVMIASDGTIAWQYLKTHPIPGPEMAQLTPSDGQLKMIDTPYGRITAIICFDGDFPPLASQARSLEADMLLNPSSDWRAIAPLHSHVASFRSIEQGLNQVRPASEGYSMAFDYQGRALSVNNYFQPGDRSMVAYIPIKGERTIYSILGDWFAWLSILGLVLCTGLAFFSKRSAKLSKTKAQN